jgi:hypothetical protein
MIKPLILFFTVLLLYSCSDKYKLYSKRYTFKSATGIPEYGSLDYWAAHPWKKDPSDSIPKPFRHLPTDSSVDVFFMHPTTFTVNLKKNKLNASIDDNYINAKTDFSTILYQASVFNQHARIFSPRYRQANIGVFMMKDQHKADSAFEIAYSDLKSAFQYYLEHWNNGRPIIIASHSQGSRLGERLLKEFFEDKPLHSKLVAAYVFGWAVPKEYFSSLKMCDDSLQTGCICSWRTVRRGFVPKYVRNENGNSFTTNPLTWTRTEEKATKKLNKGSVLTKFNKMYPYTTDAQIVNGLLWVKKPKFPWSFLYFTRNYHIGDINLFYLNIKENVGQRVREFMKK